MVRRILFLVLLTATAAAGPASALRFYVNPATGDNRRDHVTAQNAATPWKTITYALRMAHIIDEGKPHVIDIAAGTYSPSSGETFPLMISKTGIHLYSPGNVILDAQRRSRILQITAVGSNVALRSFALVNGLADHGGAVSCQSCTLRVVSSRLLNNESTDGGDVVYVADGRLEMTNNNVRYNGAAGSKGSVVEVRNTFADTSRRDVIRNNTFFRNHTPIVLTAGNRTDISSNIFVGNSGDIVPTIVDSAAGVQPLVRYNLFWDTDLLYVSGDRDSIKVWRTVRDTTSLKQQGIYVPDFVTNVPDTIAEVGSPYEFQIDVDGVRSNYSFTAIAASDIPVGMVEADANTGVLRWTPTASQVGRHAVRLEIIQKTPTARQEFLSFIITVYAAGTAPASTTPGPVYTATNVPDTTGALDSLNLVVPVFSTAASSGHNAYGNPLFLDTSINRFELLPQRIVDRQKTVGDSVVTYQDTLLSKARDLGNPIVALYDALTAGGQLRNDIGSTGGPVTNGPPVPGTAGGFAVDFLPDSLAVEGQAWTYAPTVIPSRSIVIVDPIQNTNLSLPPTFAAAFGKKPPITWTPALADTGRWFVGVESFFVGSGSARHYFQMRVRAANARPRITSTAPTAAPEDTQYVYAIQAVDDDGDAISWSVQSGPQGLTVDSLGVVRWTPQQQDVGTADVVIGLVDARGATNTQAFTLTVTNTNDPPVFTAPHDTTATEDQLLQIALAATDPDPADTLFTFNLVSGPDSVRVDSLGHLLWTPVQADVGAHAVTVAVSDAAGAMDSTSFTVTVVEVDDPPTITSAPATVAYEDAPYEYAVTGLDEERAPLTYTLVTGPTGMTIDSLGVVRWAPALADTGAHPVAVQVVDPAGQTADQAYQLVVQPVNDPPVIVSRVPADSLVLLDPGVGLTFSVQVTDEEGDLLTVQWWVNGVLRSSQPSYLLLPDTTTADTVVALVRDGTDSTSTQWIVDARAIAKIVVDTDSLDFGRVELGDTSGVVLKVVNRGRTTLTLSDLQVGALAYTASFGSDAIVKADSTTLSLVFSPTNRGVRESTVQFATNDPDHPTIVIPVRGVGAVPTTAALDLDETPGDQGARTGIARLGDTLRVDLEVQQGLELVGGAFDLGFDASVLSFAGFAPGTAFLGDGLTAVATPGDATLHVDLAGGDSTSGDGALGRIFFLVADDVATGVSADLSLASLMLRSASIAVVDTLVHLEGATVETDVAVPGDINKDGVVDLVDFFLFADDFSGAAARSDFDHDGAVDLTDFFLFADYFSAAARPVPVAQTGVEGLQLAADARPATTTEVTVDLRWQGEQALRGAGLWLTYDPRHLAFDAARGAQGEVVVLAWSHGAEAGQVEVALAPTGGAAFADDLGSVTFRRLDGEATQVRVSGAVGRLTDGAVTPLTVPGAAGVEALPQTAVLYPAHPNPFNPETVIPLFVPAGAGAEAQLRIYDLLGRPVRTLASGGLEGGHHRFVWRGRDDAERPVAAGVYLVELRTQSRRQVRKILLLK